MPITISGNRFNGFRYAQNPSFKPQTKRNELLSVVQLYKALGGGWQ
jgi:hypothetical protein